MIDDSYNSSPTALRGALDVVAREARALRKVAVLGEMLELGEQSQTLHAACGRAAAAAGVELLFVVGGGAARELASGAVSGGIPAANVSWFETSERAAPVVAGAVRSGDLVLVKGSRGIQTDLVADRIAAECS